ncbi:MAG TPA: OmpA family protein, partial [Minicystis sp.]|nr:OmpA family protein [Minicystis sp.]
MSGQDQRRQDGPETKLAGSRRAAGATSSVRRAAGALLAAAAFGATLASAAPAEAQTNTFYLDRLQIGGAPDDTFALWRPQMGERTRFFGQAALGFAFRPFRTEDLVPDPTARAAAQLATPVNEQLITYLNAGVEVIDRFSFQIGLPIIAYENGNQTNAPGVTGVQDATNVNHAALMDMRLDGRVILYRNAARSFKLGAEAGLFFPTGSKTSYGSDNGVDGILEMSAEVDFKKFFLVADTGPLFRNTNGLDGFVAGTEWRYGLGGFVPLRDNSIRLGLQLFGSFQLPQTLPGKTTTFKQDDPLEWLAEGRLWTDKRHQGFVAVGGGTRFFPGYSPDFRLMAAVGYNFSIEDTNPQSPGRRFRTYAEHGADRDHDGIPDDIDLCPDEPEDHKPPNPDDGCPALPDRDGDGIPDISDKCPDQPEDFDGIQDADGCPEDDADHDGIPDAKDACPKEPGDPDPDPSKNGCPKFIRRIKGSSEIQILQQIQFETGSAVIKKDSYKILDEVVRLLKVNPEITLLSIEGHTDNRGSDELNDKLSKARAKSCLDYLVAHGIEAKRLSSSGYGPTRPIADNNTAEGRQKNRRTEFHIRSQEGGTPVQGPGGTPPKGGAPPPPPGGAVPT